METILVISTLPDQASAEKLARLLVEGRWAACVTILGAATSVYRWQGKVESAQEVPVLIKTTQARYAGLETALRAAHPYELPEIVAVSLSAGLPAYLEWLASETAE